MQVINNKIGRELILGRYRLIIVLLVAVCSVNAFSLPPSVKQINTSVEIVRNWLHNGSIDPVDSDGLLEEETSVCLILRLHGIVLGVGTAVSTSDNPLVDAATSAFSELKKNPSLRHLRQQEMMSTILDSISIELELGGKPIPSPSKNLERFVNSITKGVDGIAVRKGHLWTTRLPSQMRLSPWTESSLLHSLESLCINAGVHPATALSRELPPNDDVRLYRIQTVAMTQMRSGFPSHLLLRGDEYVPTTSIEQSSLLHNADLLASHLIVCTNDTGTTVGGYQPETDSLAPTIASPFVQALVALALQEYATVDDTANGIDAMSVVVRILDQLSKTYVNDETMPTEVAAIIVIIHHNKPLGKGITKESLYKKSRFRLIDFASAATTSDPTDTFAPHTLAIVAKALSKIAIAEDSDELRVLAESACIQCVNKTKLQTRVSTIPWLTDAILDLNNTGSTLDPTPVIELLDIVLKTQIKDENQIDLLGGFALMTPDGIKVDARGVRVIPLLARFGVKNSLIENRSEVLHSLILAARFVSQLTTRENRADRFENSTISKGGLRVAPWDALMPTEATAMALIGVSKTIDTFHAAAQLY